MHIDYLYQNSGLVPFPALVLYDQLPVLCSNNPKRYSKSGRSCAITQAGWERSPSREVQLATDKQLLGTPTYSTDHFPREICLTALDFKVSLAL